MTTDRQMQILRVIDDSTRENGYPPSVRELCDLLGIRSTNGVADHLRRLASKGLILRGVAKARTMRLTELGRDLLKRSTDHVDTTSVVWAVKR